jgi:hypothetical protein
VRVPPPLNSAKTGAMQESDTRSCGEASTCIGNQSQLKKQGFEVSPYLAYSIYIQRLQATNQDDHDGDLPSHPDEHGLKDEPKYLGDGTTDFPRVKHPLCNSWQLLLIFVSSEMTIFSEYFGNFFFYIPLIFHCRLLTLISRSPTSGHTSLQRNRLMTQLLSIMMQECLLMKVCTYQALFFCLYAFGLVFFFVSYAFGSFFFFRLFTVLFA